MIQDLRTKPLKRVDETEDAMYEVCILQCSRIYCDTEALLDFHEVIDQSALLELQKGGWYVWEREFDQSVTYKALCPRCSAAWLDGEAAVPKRIPDRNGGEWKLTGRRDMINLDEAHASTKVYLAEINRKVEELGAIDFMKASMACRLTPMDQERRIP